MRIAISHRENEHGESMVDNKDPLCSQTLRLSCDSGTKTCEDAYRHESCLPVFAPLGARHVDSYVCTRYAPNYHRCKNRVPLRAHPATSPW